MANSKLAQRLIPLWFICYTGFTWAASTFAQDVHTFDFESLLWSGAAGLFGGAFRTILSLASSKTLVYDVRGEALKDAAVALIAGFAAYLVIEGVNSFLVTYWHISGVPREFRMLFILGAGWMRAGFFGKIDELAATAMRRAERQILGAEPPPTSEVVPLGEK